MYIFHMVLIFKWHYVYGISLNMNLSEYKNIYSTNQIVRIQVLYIIICIQTIRFCIKLHQYFTAIPQYLATYSPDFNAFKKNACSVKMCTFSDRYIFSFIKSTDLNSEYRRSSVFTRLSAKTSAHTR